jgi:hypothetical protein
MNSWKVYVWMSCQMMLATVALPSRAASPTDASALAVPAGDKAWAIELRSSGGITGRGNGNASINSAGDLIETRLYGGSMPRTGRLDSARVRDLDAAVWAAHPAKWSRSSGQIVPDGITQTLRLQRREPAGVMVYEYDLSHDSRHLPSALSILLSEFDQAVKSANSRPTSEK